MTSGRQSRGSSLLSGTMLALFAFSGFPLGDAIIKSMGGMWPAPAVAALRFCIGAAALACLLAWKEGRNGFEVARPGLHAARGFALFFGTICFFSAIFVMPLADAAAIQFVNPVLTALFSGWFLGEKLPRSAWGAMALAFAGVLVMLRPNVAEFGWVAVLPLLSAFGVAALIILNRKVSSQRSVLAAQFYVAFWAAIFLTIASVGGHMLFGGALEIQGPPDWSVVLRCMVVAVTATSCHLLLYLATTRTSAAEIAPFTYTQLLVATLLSIFVFGDEPDMMLAVGGTMIVGAGFWVIWTQRRREVPSTLPS